jgi:membrane protein
MAGDRRKATAYGFLFILIGASSVFVHLQRTLDLIWNREKTKRGALRHFMQSRAMSIGWVMFLIVLIIFFFISQVMLNFISQYVRTLIGNPIVWRTAHVVLAFTLLSAFFSFIFKLMSGKQLSGKEAIRGGAITAALFAAARTLIRYYFQVRPIGAIYGPAGWAIVIPIWVYLQWQVFLFGAHLTWHLSSDEEKTPA